MSDFFGVSLKAILSSFVLFVFHKQFLEDNEKVFVGQF